MDEEELENILHEGESETVEFKEQLSKEVFEDLSKILSAFANSKGGKIIIGINDDREVVGYVGNKSKDSEIISNIASGDCNPPIIPKINIQEYKGKSILIIEIHQSSALHSDKNRRFPYRINNIIGFMDINGIRMRLDERKSSWPNQSSTWNVENAKPIAQADFEKDLKELEEGNSELINEILKDYFIAVHKMSIEQRMKLVEGLPDLFSSTILEVRQNSIYLLETTIRISVYEKKSISITDGLLKRISKISKDDNDIIMRNTAIQLLISCTDKRAIPILIDLIINSSDTEVKSLNLLTRFGSGNLDFEFKKELKQKLHDELKKQHTPEIKKRISIVLASLRQFDLAF